MQRHSLQVLKACFCLLMLQSGVLVLSGCSPGNHHEQQTVNKFEVPADAVIAAIAAELDMDVRLKIETHRQNHQWAFFTGIPLSATGKNIDYSKTKFATDVSEGYFDDGFVALTQRNAESGSWKLVSLSLGATDAPFVDWPEQYGVPKSLIFPEN